MKEFVVLVAGSLDWDDYDRIHSALTTVWNNRLLGRVRLSNYRESMVLLSSGARGAELLAETAWNQLGGRVDRVRHDQSKQRVDLRADLCIAFIKGGSKGATEIADLAEAAGIRTVRLQE